MESLESLNGGKIKKALSQEERETKQERWSSLFQKWQSENLPEEERRRLWGELEELKKEII